MRCKVTGKIIYESYEKAAYQARWRKLHKDERTGIIYKCKYCGGWHSTSTRSVACKGRQKKSRRNEPYQRAKSKRGWLSQSGLD